MSEEQLMEVALEAGAEDIQQVNDRFEIVCEPDTFASLSEVFADFETEPQGAASVAQVHKASLYSGEQVAVKIIRPGIDRIIQKDIRLM